MIREGETPKTPGNFYTVVVHSVILYGSEKWFMTRKILGALERMHQGVAQRITGRRVKFDREMGA